LLNIAHHLAFTPVGIEYRMGQKMGSAAGKGRDSAQGSIDRLSVGLFDAEYSGYIAGILQGGGFIQGDDDRLGVRVVEIDPCSSGCLTDGPGIGH
jgi:hypothetical protein